MKFRSIPQNSILQKSGIEKIISLISLNLINVFNSFLSIENNNCINFVNKTILVSPELFHIVIYDKNCLCVPFKSKSQIYTRSLHWNVPA